jgi:hypothetical protein
MHEIVMAEMEQHLDGQASPGFYVHLAACEPCRVAVEETEHVRSLFQDLKTGTLPSMQPGPEFYLRVATHIVENQKESWWGLFSPGVVFFQRVAFASLLLLAGLGSFLAVRESGEGGADAAAIMAQHDVAAVHEVSSDREQMLVTLASYHD